MRACRRPFMSWYCRFWFSNKWNPINSSSIIIIDWDRSVGRSVENENATFTFDRILPRIITTTKKIEWDSVDTKDWLCINHRIDFAYRPGNLVTAKMKLPSRNPSNITVSILLRFVAFYSAFQRSVSQKCFTWPALVYSFPFSSSIINDIRFDRIEKEKIGIEEK